MTVRFQPFTRTAHVAHTNYRVSACNVSLKNKVVTCEDVAPDPKYHGTHVPHSCGDDFTLHDEPLIATEQDGDHFFALDHEDSVQAQAQPLLQPSTQRKRYTSVGLIWHCSDHFTLTLFEGPTSPCVARGPPRQLSRRILTFGRAGGREHLSMVWST